MLQYDTPEWMPSQLLPFFTLSYPTSTPVNPDSFPYSKYYLYGYQDLCFIITLIAIMAVLRDAFRLLVFEPFARWKLNRDFRLRSKAVANGNGVNGKGHSTKPTALEKRKIHRRVLRFAEQGWSVVYYPAQLLFGLWVHSNLPTRVLDPKDVWAGYPHIPIPGPIKFYYLAQVAFYIHQVLVLNAEAKRKDHYQMLAHHIITLFLVGCSYSYNFTRVGCLIMMLMDFCDIFLPAAKMIKYLKISQLLCDATFACFLLSWLVTRHILFNLVLWSTIYDLPRAVETVWVPEEGRYLTRGSHLMFCLCLIALQIIQLIWFGLICKVAYRVVSGKGATDARSDDEDSEEENEKDK